MLTVSLKINPFTNEVSVQKDGKPIKPTNRLSGFYKSFINTALNLKEIILEDENVDNFHMSLESSMFERMFLGTLAGKDISGTGSFQVQRKDFLVSTSLEKRIQSLFSFRKKYASGAHPIPPQDINIYASTPEDAEALVNFLNREYPWLRDIGIAISSSSRVVNTQINLFANHNEIANNAKFLPAVTHDLVPLVFCSPLSWAEIDEAEAEFMDEEQIPEDIPEDDVACVAGEKKYRKSDISVENGVVIWDLEVREAKTVIKNFFERYFLYPQIEKIISNFHPGIDVVNNFDEYVDFQLLNKVFETVIVKIPEELEKNTSTKIPIKTFFGDIRPKFNVSSNYRDIIDAECDGESVTLKAIAVGDADIKLEMEGELTPILTLNVKVVDFGYATTAQIIMEDNPEANRFITTPGSRVKLGLKYEPQTVKAAEDAKNATWIISDEKCGFFDKETMMFHAQTPGNVKVLAKLARKQASFPIIIKPNVVDYTLSIINESDDHIQEIRKSGEDQSVEYIRCYIATFLRFKLERHPENAINSPIAIEFTDGIGVEKNAEENGFVINSRRVGKGETVKISLPGCNIVKTIVIDIIPNPGNLSKDNRSATLIAASVATALLLVLGAFFLAPQNIYLLTFGFLVIAFDGYAIYKAEKNIKYILAIFTIIAIAALGFSIFKDHIGGKKYGYSGGTTKAPDGPSGPIHPTPPQPSPVAPPAPIIQSPPPPSATVQIRPVAQPDKELPAMKPMLDSRTLEWAKIHRGSLHAKYLECLEQHNKAKTYNRKAELILQYNRLYEQILTEKQISDSNPVKQKNLDREMEDFAEENCTEYFEAYTKAKRSIRNKKIIYNKAKSDGATHARLNQLQNEINEAILKFNDARQQIINIYNSKNK